MFISEAFAAPAAAATGAGSMGGTLIQLALILLIFYFFLIRPQQKKIKAHADMVEALKIGDRVLTNGGIYGTVAKLDGMEVSLEIAPNVVVVVDRMSISGVIPAEKNIKAVSNNKKNIKNTK
ncbi:MAG: preprotein translocase subunit YajC [Alphaproteobacteria bacterium]|nr:preprotein translocase subunit YajC [Alphaproteobacteria bacterium]